MSEMRRVLIKTDNGIFLGGAEEEMSERIAEEIPHKISPDTIVDGKKASEYPDGIHQIKEVIVDGEA
jgi:hypothetical protein